MFDEEFEELQQKAAKHFTIKNRVLKLIEELSELNESILVYDGQIHFEEELLDCLICAKILSIQLSSSFFSDGERLECVLNIPAQINFHIKQLSKALYGFQNGDTGIGRLKYTVEHLNILLLKVILKNYIPEEAGFHPLLIYQKKEQLKAALLEEPSF